MALKHEVYWYTQKKPKVTPLTDNFSTEIAIVGGGMMGLMCALRLHRLGKKVVLVERDFCGAGASGRSSGFITPDSELSLGMLLGQFGEEKARRMGQFVQDGVEQIRDVIEEFALPCDYEEQDSLFVAKTKKAVKDVLEEHEARQKLGLTSKLYTKESLTEAVGTRAYYAGVRYKGTYAMNAYLFCQELKEILQSVGVKIFEDTAVKSIESVRLRTEHAVIDAEQIIVCTDRYLPELKIAAPYIYSAQTFLGLSKPLSEQQLKHIFPTGPCLTWDSDLVYHYFRIADGNRLLIGGSNLLYTYFPWGKRHIAQVEKKLEQYIEERFSGLDIELAYFWPGLLGVSPDFLPIVGECKHLPQVFYGGGATGLPWAAAVGTYLAEKVVQGRDEYDADLMTQRKYAIGFWLQFLPKPLAFALAHGIAQFR